MAKQKPSASGPDRLPFDRYTVEEMAREALLSAPYNPRRINEKARKRLRKVLGKHGLVAPITWNKRTGNIVGGHQRIASLDAIHGNPNYTIQVAVIDVDDKTEKEINLALNNNEAQGEFDLELQAALMREVDLEGAGYDPALAYRLFGEAAVTEENAEVMAEVADEQEARIQRQETAIKKKEEREDYYVVFVARDGDEVSAFLADFGFDNNKFQALRGLREALERLAAYDAAAEAGAAGAAGEDADEDAA